MVVSKQILLQKSKFETKYFRHYGQHLSEPSNINLQNTK